METFQKICLVLTVVGALNWGLIGILDFNLVTFLFSEGSLLTRLIYSVIGICGIMNIGVLFSHIKEI